MSLARIVSASLSIAALTGAGEIQAQYRQPWAGAGISAEENAGGQVKSVRFIVRVENVSRGEALELSTGAAAPFVSAPVLWVIHTGSSNPIFTGGTRDSGEGLELLAETGDPAKLVQALAAKSGIASVGASARAVGAAADGPLMPGQAYEFEIVARPGQVLSTAWMFGQSNDLFYSNDRPVALFDAAGNPSSGELTVQLSLWDAGTEVNEEPGLGPNQGPRQATPDAGVTESEEIAHVRDRYAYPQIGDVLRLTIRPAGQAVIGQAVSRSAGR